MFLWVLCALSVFAAERDLTQGEDDALHTIWGVRGMRSFTDIEDRPEEFWKSIEKKLFEGRYKLRTHLQFCEWWLPLLKERIAQKIAKVGATPWFAGDAIENILKEYLTEGTPEFAYALTTYYAHAHDYTLLNITHEAEPCVHSEVDYATLSYKAKESFQRSVRADVKYDFAGIIPPDVDALRWQITPDGLFSFFDRLVAQSKGFRLCSISQNPENWERFAAHNKYFRLCSGIQHHDAFTHAKNAHKLETELAQEGIAAQDQFNACCHPKALVAGNLITMSHQVQAWFTQFHEAPSQQKAWIKGNAASLLFPGRGYLTDTGFRDITPYFAHLPLEHNWRITPLQKAKMDDYAIQGTLFAWRSLYCVQSLHLLPQKDITQYMAVLNKDLLYLTVPDVMRAPHFIQTILCDLCAFEGGAEAASTLEELIKEHQGLATIIINALEVLSKQYRDLRVHLPAITHFLSMVFYARELRILRDSCAVQYTSTKDNFGIFNNEKCVVALAELFGSFMRQRC